MQDNHNLEWNTFAYIYFQLHLDLNALCKKALTAPALKEK